MSNICLSLYLFFMYRWTQYGSFFWYWIFQQNVHFLAFLVLIVLGFGLCFLLLAPLGLLHFRETADFGDGGGGGGGT